MWDLPDYKSAGGAGHVVAAIVNDWQLSGILTAGSGYARNTTSGYTYQSNGQNVNLTGSPDYAAKIVYVGDPGNGCSDNQYGQFNTAAVTGPDLQQRRARIGPQHPRRMPGQDRRPGARP